MSTFARPGAALVLLATLPLVWALLDALATGDYVAGALLGFGTLALGQVGLEWWAFAEGHADGGGR